MLGEDPVRLLASLFAYRGKLPILGLYPDPRPRNVCPLLHVIVMRGDEIMGQIMEYIEKMEEITGKKFGDKENPLLVSVRSGARASMPGMMDTILNLGLNEEVVEVLAAKSGNPRWASDCYRRFIQMFSDVVMEVGKKYFEALIDQMKMKKRRYTGR